MQQDLPENNVVRNFAPGRIELPLTYSHNEQYYWMKYKWRCLSSKTFKKDKIISQALKQCNDDN